MQIAAPFQHLGVNARDGKHEVAVKYPSRLDKVCQTSIEGIANPACQKVCKVSGYNIVSSSWPPRYFTPQQLPQSSLLFFCFTIVPFLASGCEHVLWSIGGFIVCYAVPQGTTATFHCPPMNAAWDPAAHATANCIRPNLECMIVASLNVLTDIVTLYVPLPLLWRLQIDMERNVQLIGVFLLKSL